MSRPDDMCTVLDTISIVLREIADLPLLMQIAFAQEVLRAVITAALPRFPDTVTYEALVDQTCRALLEMGPAPVEELPS